MGRLRGATKRYVPASPRRRHRWHEDADFARPRAFLPIHERDPIGGRLERLVHELRGLPTDADGFGLVHTDAHFGNVLHHDGELTLIDFDDCAYEWFASDTAIVLFYVAIDPRRYAGLARSKPLTAARRLQPNGVPDRGSAIDRSSSST